MNGLAFGQAEVIRSCLESKTTAHPGQPMSISVGLAISMAAETRHGLNERADQAKNIEKSPKQPLNVTRFPKIRLQVSLPTQWRCKRLRRQPAR